MTRSSLRLSAANLNFGSLRAVGHGRRWSLRAAQPARGRRAAPAATGGRRVTAWARSDWPRDRAPPSPPLFRRPGVLAAARVTVGPVTWASHSAGPPASHCGAPGTVPSDGASDRRPWIRHRQPASKSRHGGTVNHCQATGSLPVAFPRPVRARDSDSQASSPMITQVPWQLEVPMIRAASSDRD